MSIDLFDTHAHLTDPILRSRIDEVLQGAAVSNVRRILCVGTTLKSSCEAIEIATTFPNVWASVGIHPNHAHEASDADWDEIQALSGHERVVAVGETGLDRYWDDCPWEIQVANFRRHLTLSQTIEKPIVIHMRDCEAELIEIIEGFHAESGASSLSGILHSFTGSLETARRAIAIGLHISFAGMLTYKKSDELRSIASLLPVDRILVETDSPYLSPEPHRKLRPNEPKMVRFTADCLADSLSMSLEELAQQTTTNARKLFRIDD